MFMLTSEITQFTAHHWNVIRGHKIFIAGKISTTITNCL